jgi:hypothetical protein
MRFDVNRSSLEGFLLPIEEHSNPPQKFLCLRGFEPDRLDQVMHAIDQGLLDPSGVVGVRNQDFALQRRRVPDTQFLDDVVEFLLVQSPLRSSSSTIAAISHMLEMVVSQTDMVSCLWRWSIMNCAITSCRMQISTELHQHSQVELVSTCLPLSC